MSTQAVLNRKHLGWWAVKSLSRILAGNLARGQTNTLKMLWKFNSVYDPQLQLADHAAAGELRVVASSGGNGCGRHEVDLYPSAGRPDEPCPRPRHRVVRQ